MNGFVNCQILLLISLFFFLNAAPQILKIPLTYYPYRKYNDSTPEHILDNIIFQRVYANIKIGTPISDVQIQLSFKDNEFLINDINIKSSFEPKLFNDLKFYESSKSKTCYDTDDSYDQFCGDYFHNAYHKIDCFYFNNRNETFEFFLPYDPTEEVSGIIGMQLSNYRSSPTCENTLYRNRSLIEILKKKNFVSSYSWNIFYNSKEYKDKDEGFLLIGALPHEIGSDLGYYKSTDFPGSNLKTVNILNPNYEPKFTIDKIDGYYGKNTKNLIEKFHGITDKYKKVEIDYHCGGVRGPKDLLEHVSKAFEDYLKNNLCFNGSTYEMTYFYCKKEIGGDINKIREKFPGILLKSNDLDKVFNLDVDDLFLEVGNYIFCLLYFKSDNDGWVMGKPFLKKYQFSFNTDENYIAYYLKKEAHEDDTGIPVYVLVIAIVGTVLVVALISFLLFKYYFYEKCTRKKRANELTEDFEYTSKTDEQKDNENQRDNNENDKLGLDINN